MVELGRVDRSFCGPGLNGILARSCERALVVAVLDNHHPPRAFTFRAGVFVGKCICLFLRISRSFYFDELTPMFSKLFALHLSTDKLPDAAVERPTATALLKLLVCR